MCGIAGVVFFAPRDPAHVHAVLGRMNAAQAFRGPDGEGVWTDGRVGLGHRRLALVGDSEHGKEPLADEQGCQLVFNGEIYRPADVLESLGQTMAAEDSDSRALHLLLGKRGPAGLDQVDGCFAAGRYDPQAGRLLLVRDAWGQKPLYHYRTDEAFYFASTVAAIRAAVGSLRVRPEALLEYLVYKSVGGYRSAFRDVEQLPPASWLEVDLDGVERAGRWHVPPAPGRTAADPAEVRRVLDGAVAERLAARFEQGIFLSGGLDSSLVLDSAVRQCHGSRLRFYSVGYDAEGTQDERPLARRMAQGYPYPHEEVQLTAAQVPELFLDVARCLEDPIQDPVTLPTLLLCRSASRHTRCVLTGDGSDEFWGGYERFDDPPEKLADYWPRTALFTPEQLPPPPSYLDQLSLPPASWPVLDQILYCEAGNRLRNYHLARVDKLSMSCGLEVRSPFLDRQVTDLALSLPADLKRPGGQAKGLLMEAYRDVLPAWLLERKKQPFSVPIWQWLSGPLRDYAHDRLGPRARSASVLAAEPYLDQPGAANQVWSLLQLEAWMEVHAG